MIVCASEEYLDSKNCQLELEYGFKKNLPMIPIKLDQASKLDDHIVLASLIYVSYIIFLRLLFTVYSYFPYFTLLRFILLCFSIL